MYSKNLNLAYVALITISIRSSGSDRTDLIQSCMPTTSDEIKQIIIQLNRMEMLTTDDINTTQLCQPLTEMKKKTWLLAMNTIEPPHQYPDGDAYRIMSSLHEEAAHDLKELAYMAGDSSIQSIMRRFED